ncbi:beta-ribofuranosylaminobenzene 5'-phosphate synthase [Methanococcoides sp. NM1]|uniref:beta-ribofuranosylaminobenzene 5'-phosphate synthase n=1 Tax=Methanococcoides sp. NM1 TaxID=1201013 RepID=UPI001082B682|nr:beta-ribofuranosylaminobenzene 5'-phosphate synthase [Methanococcoides sp. NM1]
MIKIRSPSRLHLSLIDMNAEIGRVDGGVGITLDSPNITLSAEKHDGIEITGGSSLSDRVYAAVEALLPEGEGIKVHVEEDMPPHVGLGSGTQIALSAAAAVNELYGLGMSVNELAIRVGRGGTSGIGVASFEKGGFLVDCGHKFSEKGSFSPSSASRADPAPVIFRHNLPDWDIILALPDSKGAHDAQEVDIFKKECPIPLQEVQEVCHVVLMQMMPAIIEGDIENFGMALNHLQTVGFKRREVALQSPAVRDLIEFMQDLGAAGAGMSSFGPVVFGVVDHRRIGEQIKKEAQLFLDETVGGNVVLTRANNSGAKIWKD